MEPVGVLVGYANPVNQECADVTVEESWSVREGYTIAIQSTVMHDGRDRDRLKVSFGPVGFVFETEAGPIDYDPSNEARIAVPSWAALKLVDFIRDMAGGYGLPRNSCASGEVNSPLPGEDA